MGPAAIPGSLMKVKVSPSFGMLNDMDCNGQQEGRSMSQTFTKEMARNIFYGGSGFFLLLFLALTFDTNSALPNRDNRANITEKVALGKKVWEEHNCIGCHTLLGEGAYFAPELGNVYKRFGNSKEAIVGFIKSRPAAGIPGRRSMPQFNLSDAQLDAVAEFLKYASEINAANWPPTIQG
jgi:nitric oxide reductase subunit C